MDEEERQLKVQTARLEKIPTLEWQAFEYNYNEKNSDWFWMVGIVGGIAVILAILFKNFLFAIILLLSTFTVLMYGARKPELITFAITAKGIRIKNDLYPFKNLKGFAIKEDDDFAKLMIHSDRLFLPHIIIPLEDIDPELIRERLSIFLDEEHFEETFVDIFVERLGF
ncbi:MAG: hypothetical protein K8Q91_00430 [Candidatus Vogelbacteria bacterium]|nr:hypothetical protein [Candidatus Vogelbacteria bacterium]